MNAIPNRRSFERKFRGKLRNLERKLDPAMMSMLVSSARFAPSGGGGGPAGTMPSVVQSGTYWALPGAPAAGNLILAFFQSYTDLNTQPMYNNGWTLLNRLRNSGASFMWYRYAVGGDSGTYSSPMTGGSFNHVIVVEVQDADPDWFLTTEDITFGPTSSGAFRGMTTVSDNCLALAFSGQTFGGGSQTLSSPWTSVITGAGGFANTACFAQDCVTAPVSITGTWSSWLNGAGGSYVVILRPAQVSWAGPNIVQMAVTNSGDWAPPTFGSTPTVGNLVLCFGAFRAGVVADCSDNGWTLDDRVNSSGTQDCQLFYRYVQGGDGTSYSTPQNTGGTNGNFPSYIMLEIENVNSTFSTALEHVEYENVTSGTDTTSFNTGGTNRLCLSFMLDWGDGGDSYPGYQDGGFSPIEQGEGAFTRNLLVQHKELASGVSTSVAWFTQHGNTTMPVITVCLRG